MAGSLNKVMLIGNLGKDPEVRSTQDGGKIVTFTMATTESWKDRTTGERRDRTEWHRVVIFNEGLAGVAERYLRKGSKVFIEGQLQTRKWVDQQGVEKYTTEVVLTKFRGEMALLSPVNEGGGMPQENWYQEPVASSSSPTSAASAAAIPASNDMSAATPHHVSSSQDFPTPAADEIDDDVPF